MYFQDRDIALDCINSQKQLNSTYTYAVSESSNASVRNDMISILNDGFNDQYMIFEMMNRKGWYKPFAANQQDLSTAKNDVNNLNNQMQSAWKNNYQGMQGISNQYTFTQTPAPANQYCNQTYGDRPGQDWGGASNSSIEKNMWSNIGSYAGQEVGSAVPSPSERNGAMQNMGYMANQQQSQYNPQTNRGQYGDRPGQDWGGASNSNIEKNMWSNISNYAGQEVGTVNPSPSERNPNLDSQR